MRYTPLRLPTKDYLYLITILYLVENRTYTIISRKIDESIMAPNIAIYLLQFSTKKPQYLNVNPFYKIKDLERFQKIKEVKSETKQCKKSDFMAYPIASIKTLNIFESPRKFTIRGQFKAFFSGASRALVSVNIPANATDLLYSLRIFTSELDRTSDGEFNNNIRLCSIL